MNVEAKLSANAVLTPGQVESFKERGFVIADFGLDPDQLDRIVTRVRPLYGSSYEENPTLPARAQDAWKTIDEVRQLARNEKIAMALEQLCGRKALPFQTLNFPVGTRQCAHSDTIHFNSIPAGYMVGVWVALEDIDADNGPLIYYPGSHKMQEYSMRDFGLDPGYGNYRHYEARMQELIAAEKLEPEYGTIKKGEALIWHANLLHGGAPQKDMSRSRHSQVTHFYFENCRYYTPMNSRAGSPAFRDPEWIPEQPYDPQRAWRNSLVKRVVRKLGRAGNRAREFFINQ